MGQQQSNANVNANAAAAAAATKTTTSSSTAPSTSHGSVAAAGTAALAMPVPTEATPTAPAPTSSPPKAVPVRAGSRVPSPPGGGVVFGSPLPSPLNPQDFRAGSSTFMLGHATASSARTAKQKTSVPTVLTWTGGGDDVLVAGSFSKWTPLPLSKSRNDFLTVLELPPGHYALRFLVDGVWRCNTELPTALDVNGELANILDIHPDGSCMDSENDPTRPETKDPFADSAFTQVMPTEDPNEKEPPVMPSHLSKIILNSDTVSESDPSVLPVPHHVMLQHLYALSIKDGVMVLSSTMRYRHKFVTSVLYKPVTVPVPMTAPTAVPALS